LTQHHEDLTLRPITGPDELGLFNRLSYVLDPELAGDLESGRRHPQWMWVALLGDRLVARAAWWSRAGDDTPLLMDVLDLDPAVPGSADAAVRLVETALAALLPDGAARPEYLRFVPGDWRDHAETRRTVDDRMAVLERTGAKLFVERLRLEWHAGTPIADPDGRLTFRPVTDTEELIGLMTKVMDGTLDAHGRDDLTRMPAADAARKHYDEELALYRTPRDWWQIAMNPAGEAVGFVIPARNAYNPIIAYIGVLPEHRGKGYIDGILAVGTCVLAAQGVERIRANTDVGNVPMAQAFARAGYVNFERQIDMTWP
jgi:hypothetical protein